MKRQWGVQTLLQQGVDSEWSGRRHKREAEEVEEEVVFSPSSITRSPIQQLGLQLKAPGASSLQL
jgi:hypothetical protein